MFELKHLLVGVPPTTIDLRLVGVCTIFYWLILGYYKGQSRKLTHIPSIGSNVPLFSYIVALNYLLDARKIINAGVNKWPSSLFKFPEMLQWMVVATGPRMIEEIRKAPDSALSFKDAAHEFLQFEYTIGEHIKDPYHLYVIRKQLTKALPQLVPEMHAEIVDAFNELIPLSNDWTGVKALETFREIICRASNRIFVGRPLCRNPDFVALNIQYTIDVVLAAALIRIVPRFLKLFVSKLVSKVPERTRQGLKHLAPLLAARRKERQEIGDHHEKPADFLTWLFDEAEGKEATDLALTSCILVTNFAAIHTSSTAFTHAMYNLATFPEYMKPLREEVEEIIRREGWTKAGIDQMHRLDSFIKESQRLHTADIFVMRRIARHDYTFSDGMVVPRGTLLGVAARATHLDEKIYPDALNFDPFRFVKLQEQETGGRRFDLVTTSVDSLNFGHGRHACPGRYFIACELKLMLAHVIMNYDVKLENEGVRPKDMWFISACMPNMNAKVLFRRRVD